MKKKFVFLFLNDAESFYFKLVGLLGIPQAKAKTVSVSSVSGRIEEKVGNGAVNEGWGWVLDDR